MYKFLFLFFILPMSLFGQDDDQQQIYLSNDNKVSTAKSDYRCVLNKEQSREYAKCYDCYDGANKLVRQLNTNLYVSKDVMDEANKPYVKSGDNANYYLIGELKDGKPFNGFFKQPGASLEWKIYSLYKDGIVIQQIYNNMFKTITQEKDTEMAFTTVDSKNTFKNGSLDDGIAVTGFKIKGGAAEIMSMLKNGKPESYTIGIFAMHYGEFIKVIPLTKGYRFENLGKGAIAVEFNDTGRELKVFDEAGKQLGALDMAQYDLADENKADAKRPVVYLQKDKKIYLEQVKDPTKSLDQLAGSGELVSRAVMKIAFSFYNYKVLNMADLEGFFADDYPFGNGTFLGDRYIDEKGINGFSYKKGDKEGVYNVDFYEDGRIAPNKLSFKNKTTDEIVQALLKL